ncbi:MAG TPA: hypothetical protein VLI90_07090 [Tepidisphaeraceae bacterium]|nr:hypothetical protein [Tepidisphaeraceae bacterium]
MYHQAHSIDRARFHLLIEDAVVAIDAVEGEDHRRVEFRVPSIV